MTAKENLRRKTDIIRIKALRTQRLHVQLSGIEKKIAQIKSQVETATRNLNETQALRKDVSRKQMAEKVTTISLNIKNWEVYVQQLVNIEIRIRSNINKFNKELRNLKKEKVEISKRIRKNDLVNERLENSVRRELSRLSDRLDDSVSQDAFRYEDRT